jgi:uncharacterized protein YciI
LRICLAAIAIGFAAPAPSAEPPATPLFVVHFEIGPAWDKSAAPQNQPGFGDHSANLNRLRNEGVIVFGARYDEFGMIVLKAEALATAKNLMEADPGVRIGLFSYRITPLNVFYPWRE